MFYGLLLLLHIASVFAFLLVHGVSLGMAFRIRKEQHPERIKALLELSAGSYSWMQTTLGLVLLTGVAAGFAGSWWGRGWIWAALLIFVGVSGAMWLTGSRQYGRVRRAAGLGFVERGKFHSPADAATPGEIVKAASETEPWIVTAIGGVGLMIILTASRV